MMYRHLPVMLPEVLSVLSPRPGQIYIDCTLGGAGYTLALAAAVGERGKVVSIDADSLAIANAQNIIKEKKIENIVLVHDNFKNLAAISDTYLDSPADGIVFDLGLSSAQLDDESRGFSFQGDRPLDMAFGSGADIETAALLNRAPLSELARIFRELGEEPQAYRLAKEIVAARKAKAFTSTKPLVDIILKVSPPRLRAGKIHPATRAFQALRLATNDEFGSLRSALKAVPAVLKVGGRLALVSFHSGEDRIVKQWLKEEGADCLCPPRAPVCVCGHKASFRSLLKKPLLPGAEEVEQNPRARSAKLRAAEKIR
ncbi:MAG: 16S rRNA (cytosine(1402)-N(4))-methyltransferase RsmH [Patescibacteria group bacterium]|nr:16S rRNA (cytosine(1402)-N(4))-methyltransferase RsmH [Patescibacteria group bacterium]